MLAVLFYFLIFLWVKFYSYSLWRVMGERYSLASLIRSRLSTVCSRGIIIIIIMIIILYNVKWQHGICCMFGTNTYQTTSKSRVWDVPSGSYSYALSDVCSDIQVPRCEAACLQREARFPFKCNRLRCVRCVNENRKKRVTGPSFISRCVFCESNHSFIFLLLSGLSTL